MQYTNYSWPAGAHSFQLEFYLSQLRVTEIVASGYKQNRISHGASPDQPGLLLAYPNFTAGRGHPYTFPVNDPPSLSTIRWMVRDALNDVATEDTIDLVYPDNPKWPDREINAYIREAIALLNVYRPREVIIETPRDNIRAEMLRHITEVIDITFYSEPTREWLSIPRYSRRGHRGSDRYWDRNGTFITLYGSYPDNVMLEIRANAEYPMPANDFQELLVEREEWDILSMYAQAKAYLRLAGQSAQLDRWKEEGKRNDNPITPVARLLLDSVDRRLKERKGPRTVRRYRA